MRRHRLVYGLLAALSLVESMGACGRSRHRSEGGSSTTPDETEARTPDDGRPADEGEGIPGYLTDPRQITINNLGDHIDVSAPKGAVAAAGETPLAELKIAHWSVNSSALASAASSESEAAISIQGTLIKVVQVGADGSFTATLPGDLFVNGAALMLGVVLANPGDTIVVGNDEAGRTSVALNTLSSAAGTRPVSTADFASGTFRADAHYFALGAVFSGYDSFAATGVSAGGSGDGQFNFPVSVATSPGFLFVADSNNSRIQRFEVPSGRFAGWVGRVAVAPTGGGQGCLDLRHGDVTPGWCYGGTSMPGDGSGDGSMIFPAGLSVASNTLYVADNQSHAVLRFDLGSGAFTGWIGGVESTPNLGTETCAVSASPPATLGWCDGGASKAGIGDGQFAKPWGITNDGTYLYVVDQGSSRVARFEMTTGTFAGWIGGIGTQPTGGDTGCAAAAVGALTPGWCIGGTGAVGLFDGGLRAPQGIFSQGGYLYVTQMGPPGSVPSYPPAPWRGSPRITRFNSASGSFAGALGQNASGCSTGTDTDATGWCSESMAPVVGTEDGILYGPTAAVATSDSLVVVDSNTFRVKRYEVTTGLVRDWLGAALVTPTSSGCLGMNPLDATPIWCQGGSATPSAAPGGFRRPIGAALDESGNLYIADAGSHRIVRRNATTGAFLGNLGAVGSASANRHQGGRSMVGVGDGMHYSLGALWSDANYLYVADSNATDVMANNRLSRYRLADGAFAGWVGKVRLPPTGGDAGCATANANAYTPGWCLGGESTGENSNETIADEVATQSIGGFTLPSGLSTFDGSLFVADLDRITRVDARTGAITGWIGGIDVTPTGGATDCTIGTNSVTPGWCTGGYSRYGTEDGAFGSGARGSSVGGVFADGSGFLYLADRGNHKIQKIAATSGAFVGWIGVVAASPTGGASGCASTGAGQFTPGWCTGGRGQPLGDKVLAAPSGIHGYGNYIYVADLENHRVNRYESQTGAWVGWIGGVDTPPTGGAKGCTAATKNNATPGWCLGGTALAGDGDGMLHSPAGVFASADALYVADDLNSRIVRYNLDTGAFTGWRGLIAEAPADGDPGCSTASVGTATPGWCLGGRAGPGTDAGTFVRPQSLYVDAAGTLYVGELSSGRVSIILAP